MQGIKAKLVSSLDEREVIHIYWQFMFILSFGCVYVHGKTCKPVTTVTVLFRAVARTLFSAGLFSANYLAPGYSYDQFLKAYECTAQKGFFPYEWFDDVAKLDYETLPAHDDFYSALHEKQKHKR